MGRWTTQVQDLRLYTNFVVSVSMNTGEEEPSASAAKAAPDNTTSHNSNDNASGSKRNGKPTTKCIKCNKRWAREGCTQKACLNCCDDLEGCETHKKPRAQAELKEQILAGTTEVQKLAAAKRKLRIPANNFFREPGFVYQGDTVIIWDIRAYVRDEKAARDEAVRMSKRRAKHKRDTEADAPTTVKPLRNSRKRFRRIWDDLFQASLTGNDEE